MPAYLLAQVEIHDRDGFRQYTSEFAPTLEPFGGKVLAADDDATPVEGIWPAGRVVIIEFDTAETAQAWYESDAYQQISSIRRAHSDASMTIVTGLASPSAE